jgi:hypothetical protein
MSRRSREARRRIPSNDFVTIRPVARIPNFPFNKPNPSKLNMKKLPKIAKSHIAGISFALAMASMPCLLQAQNPEENLLKNGGAESGNGGGWVKRDIDGWGKIEELSNTAKEGEYAFIIHEFVMSGDLIPVDPQAQYELSAYFLSEGPEVIIYFGFECYDADKKLITSQSVTAIPRTETKLSEAASKGSSVLKIENGQEWVMEESTPEFGFVAFDVDDSGAYSDLPNSNLSAAGIKAIRQVGGYWEVELAKPLPADFAAGTKVRQHKASGSYLYVAGKIPVGNSWKKLRGRVSGVSADKRDDGMFWPGTKFVRVILFNALSGQKNNILVDELTLSRMD